MAPGQAITRGSVYFMQGFTFDDRPYNRRVTDTLESAWPYAHDGESKAVVVRKNLIAVFRIAILYAEWHDKQDLFYDALAEDLGWEADVCHAVIRRVVRARKAHRNDHGDDNGFFGQMKSDDLEKQLCPLVDQYRHAIANTKPLPLDTIRQNRIRVIRAATVAWIDSKPERLFCEAPPMLGAASHMQPISQYDEEIEEAELVSEEKVEVENEQMQGEQSDREEEQKDEEIGNGERGLEEIAGPHIVPPPPGTPRGPEGVEEAQSTQDDMELELAVAKWLANRHRERLMDPNVRPEAHRLLRDTGLYHVDEIVETYEKAINLQSGGS
ncbi:hypothetical protein CONLIGDRAFT_715185 [Coniochaeta ligniaria NRRL 30616]|uniref:Uncharacterized protein n=1 Tax=Coniochaeta ligniaria NRRL 30616 TaxID=1408157 RepID=A0A1J7IML1_9PEZI|nr:hypothetical protein CONLIGDRAFT_715185 [Coniochaeta ligniaria NRRL 30616]